MKAKDYAKRFEEQGRTIEALAAIVHDFVDEIKTLSETRRVSTDAGMAAVVREILQKYAAFARITGLPEDGLKRFLQARLGPLHEELMRRG
ncbi:MAG TPA: hypothetical protein VFF68_02615 [Anaerolineaceae bacterium]|nr:hypothetical protein [Anaerolineaceae bacterium]